MPTQFHIQNQKFFLFLQKYLHIDLAYFVKNSFWITIGQILSSLASLMASIAFAHFISKEDFGTYKYITGTIAGILAISTLSGANNSLIRSVSLGYDKTFYVIFKQKMKWGLLGLLCGLIASGYYFFNHNTSLALLILITAVITPFFDPLYTYSSFLNGKAFFQKNITYDSVLKFLSTAGIILTIIYTKNIFVIVVIYFIVNSLLRLFFYFKTTKFINPKSSIDPTALSYGKHLSFMKSLSLASGYLHQIALFHFLGPSSIALFAIAVAPIEQARGLVASISTIFIPKFSQENWEILSLKNFIKKILPFLIFLGIGIIIYILLAPILYQLFFSKYTEVIGLSQLYAPSLILTSINILLTSILSAKRLIKEQYIINIFEFIVQIFLSLPLIYFFGVNGLLISYILLKLGDSFIMTWLIFGGKNFLRKKLIVADNC